ncbi:MAG: RNA methyltransferase [Clostridia bacterium]|nr:RNA methyltransferase [Clostridia bacterium]
MISAKDNELIKQVTALISSPKRRKESGSFPAEGVRLCVDGVQSGAEVRCFLYTDAAREKYADEYRLISSAAKRCEEISESLFRKISDTQNPQGFLCVFTALDKNHKSYTINKQGRYAALENIQDPSNMGTILRTAEALGIDGVILSEDCCDIYSPKVVRGSMGAVFRVPVIIVRDFTSYIKELTETGIFTYASTPHEAEDIKNMTFENGGVMLIGNEGNGLRPETINACSKSVRINMKGRAESLNAAAAAAILLYSLLS